MKIIIVISILTILSFTNCSEKNITENFERNAFTYNSEKPKEEIFDLKIEEKEGFHTYKYVSLQDSSKIVEIKFLKENKLYFGPQEFIIVKHNSISFQEIPNVKFDFYQMKTPVTDGTGPILFNEQYGILGIYNVFGPRIIFLNDSNKELSYKILKALQE